MYSCGHSSSAAGASAAQLVNDQDPGSRDAETSSAAQGASGEAQLANQVMLAEYSAMRSEVDQRTSVQWNVIAPQITSTGVIASLAISRVADIVLLLVIPLLSYMLGTRYILNDYHINLISRYIRVAVGSSRTEIFFYASSAGSADVAAQVAREVLARHDVSVPFWTERSSRRDKEWRDVTDEPPADIAAELQAEHEYRQEQDRERSRRAGVAAWRVRVDVLSDRDAVALAGHLAAQGWRVRRRRRHPLVGAECEDDAKGVVRELSGDGRADAETAFPVRRVSYSYMLFDAYPTQVTGGEHS